MAVSYCGRGIEGVRGDCACLLRFFFYSVHHRDRWCDPSHLTDSAPLVTAIDVVKSEGVSVISVVLSAQSVHKGTSQIFKVFRRLDVVSLGELINTNLQLGRSGRGARPWPAVRLGRWHILRFVQLTVTRIR